MSNEAITTRGKTIEQAELWEILLQIAEGALGSAEDLYEKIVDAVYQLTRCSVAMWRVNEDNRDQATIRAHRGLREEYARERVLDLLHSVTGEVIRDGELIEVENIEEDPRVAPETKAEAKKRGWKSMLVVPLLAGPARTVGTVSIYSNVEGGFAPWEIDRLRTFASQAGVALQNADRLDTIHRLNDVGQSLATLQESPQVLKQTLERIAETTLQVLRTDVVDVYEYIADRDRFVLPPIMVGIRRFPELVPIEILSDDVVARIAHTGQAIYAINAQEHPVLIGEWTSPREERPKDRFVVREGIISSAGVPVKVGEEVVGVLFVNYRQRRDFDADLELRERIEILASFAGVAIQNARLLQQERSLRRQAETLREVSATVSSALGLKEVAQRILSKLGEVIEYHKATMQLIRGDSRTLLAWRGFGKKDVSEWLLRPVSQDPLISRVVASKEPLILSDPLADLDWEVRPETEDVKSWVGLPLVFGEETVGLLTLDHQRPGFYTQAFRGLLMSFAHQAAIAIENARLFDDAQRRIRDLRIVDNVTQIIGTKLDTQDLLQTIVSQIADRLKCTHCTLFFPQEEDGELLLVPRVTHGVRSKQIMKRRFEPGEGLAGWAFQKGQSLALADATKDPRFAPATDPRQQPRSMLVAPVKVGERTIGVISADQDEYGWFSDSDRRLVDALGRQAGIAIERAAGLELLQQIGMRILSPQTVNQILHEIVSGAIQLTHTTSGVIHLISEDGTSVVDSCADPPDFAHPKPRLDRKEGLTYEVVATGQTLIWPDIRQDPRVSPDLHDRVRSMIAVPLKVEERVVGVLFLNDERQHDFTETEVSLLTTLASQAAMAIENTRLFERRAQDISALAEINEAILTEGLEESIQLIADRAARSVDADHCVLRLIDNSGKYLIPKATAGRESRQDPLPIDDESFTGWVASQKKAALCSNVSQDEHYLKWYDDVRSCMAAPLTYGGRLMGTLYVESTRLNAFYETAQLALLQAFADQAAIAIENARLFQELDERAKRLVRLQEVVATISAEPANIEEVLHLIVENLIQMFSGAACAIRLYDSTTDEFGRRMAAGVLREQVKYTPRSKGLGTSRYVVERKTPLYVVNTLARPPEGQPRVRKELLERGVRAIAYLPLIGRDGDAIGVLYLNLIEPHWFSQNDKQILELFAHQASIAIENARLYEQRAEDIAALQEINEAVVSKELDEILDLVVETAVHAMPGEHAELWLRESETDDLVLQAVYGAGKAAAEKIGRISADVASINRRVADTGKPFICEDAAEEAGFLRIYEAAQSSVTVSLQCRGEVIGTLNVESERLGAFTEEHSRLLDSFSDQAAIAIENARLYEQRVRDIAVLQEVNEVVTTASWTEIAALIAQKAKDLTRAEYSGLWIVDEDRLILGAMSGREPKAEEEPPQVLKIDERSTNGWVAVTGEPYVCSDVVNDPHYLRWRKDIQCSMAVPLRWRGELIGTLGVESAKPRAFSDYQVRLLQSLADQAAIAIENARLYEQLGEVVEQLKRRVTSLAAVSGVGHQLTASIRLSEDDIVKLIYQQAGRVMHTDNMQIALYDAETDVVWFALAYLDGEPVDVDTAPGWGPRRAGQGRTERIIRERQPLVSYTKAESKAWYERPGHKDYIGQTFASWVGVPMIVGEKVLGVIATYHAKEEYVYDEDDVQVLSLMASQAAIALDNARLVRQLDYLANRKVRDLEAASEVGQALTASIRLSEEEIVALIYQQASRVMHTANMYIALYDAETDIVWFALAYMDEKKVDVKTAEGWGPRRAGKGRTEWIVRHREPLLFSGTQADSKAWYEQSGRKDYIRQPFTSWVGVPMMVGEKVLGVIATYHTTEEHVYDEDDEQVLSLMASQAAIALDNARLVRQLEQRVNELDALRELAEDLSAGALPGLG